MKQFMRLVMVMIIAALWSTPVFAAMVSWTDWISSQDNFSASGEILAGGATVGVDYSGTGSHRFVQTGTGTNYWTGTAYTNGAVDNSPTAAELVALRWGGTVTIAFTETVMNPYLGLVSWNTNSVEFGVPIDIDSYGRGYWGDGTPVLNSAGTGFYGNGEVHGVIQLIGAFDSITFTHTSENWHGFTVGVSSVPVPAAVWFFVSGFIGIVGMKRVFKN